MTSGATVYNRFGVEFEGKKKRKREGPEYREDRQYAWEEVKTWKERDFKRHYFVSRSIFKYYSFKKSQSNFFLSGFRSFRHVCTDIKKVTQIWKLKMLFQGLVRVTLTLTLTCLFFYSYYINYEKKWYGIDLDEDR